MKPMTKPRERSPALGSPHSVNVVCKTTFYKSINAKFLSTCDVPYYRKGDGWVNQHCTERIEPVYFPFVIMLATELTDTILVTIIKTLKSLGLHKIDMTVTQSSRRLATFRIG